MDYREVTILADKVVADSGTETVDLSVTDPITELSVDFKVKNAAAIAEDVPPERCISKIEIVDGGRVYWSTAGLEAVAASVYDKLRWPSSWYYEGASGNQRIWIPLQFGRYLGDEQYNFNPRALLNPQLKVTWAKNTLHITNQVELGVRAKVMQGSSPAGQALLTKSVRSFVTAASGVEPTDIPTDAVIRRLFIGGEFTGTDWGSGLTHCKLDCDLGKFIVFDLDKRKMMSDCENTFGLFGYRKHDYVDAQRYVRSWFGRTYSAHFEASAGDYIINCYTTSSDNYYVSAYDADKQQVSDISGVAWVTGSLPQYILCYPFGRVNDPETWFDAKRYGKISLELTQAVASGTARILVQQVVSVP
jgi:hypothetical protein